MARGRGVSAEAIGAGHQDIWDGFYAGTVFDLEIVSAVLSKPFGFCGLIGSATKRALFERRLGERGFSRETIAKLTCPIGLPMLKDKRPEAIAASVTVQLLLRDQVLRGRS